MGLVGMRQDGGAQDERRKASSIGDPTRSFIEGYRRTLLKPAKNTNVASMQRNAV
jgi:hypothetical protein